MSDHYCPCKMFRRDIFDAALTYLDAGVLRERDVAECLKECLEFIYGGSASSDVVRDFCIVRVRRSRKADNGEAETVSSNA